jgi:hypothetical protein
LSEPVIAVPQKSLSLPLFGDSQVRAIPQIHDDPQGLAIKLKRDDTLYLVAPRLFDLE